jgi:hypothetical protein
MITRLIQCAISLGVFFIQLMSTACWASHLFINEFHYDNIGADTNEQVEIAGPAGTVLQNWQLIFYNGHNGEAYYSKNLAGIISDQSNGYGSLSFAIPAIQNGPADAIALIDDQKNVIEFIGYEGSLLAVNGPAAGMHSSDINWVETGASDPNTSIQRQGTGSQGDDFYWQIDTASPNSINQHQYFELLAIPIPAGGWLFISACGVFIGYKRSTQLIVTRQSMTLKPLTDW